MHINTDRIIEFSNENITTFTFNIITTDTNVESFVNLIFFEKNNQVGQVVLKYTPNDQWIRSLKEGVKLPFSGFLSLMNTDGEIIQTEELIDGVPQGRSSSSPCSFSATPIWIDCYGSECPCKDGKGYLGGWNYEINCDPVGGGGGSGGGSGSGNPSGGGGGSGNNGNGGVGDYGQGQQQGSNGDLPTDPLEWNLFNQLNSLRNHPDDYFYFNPPVAIDEDLIFENFTEFRNFILNYEHSDDEVMSDQDGTEITTIILRQMWGPDIKIIVKSTLKDNSKNQEYLLHNIDGFFEGNNYIGYFFNVKSFYLNRVNANNWAEIIIYAEIGINAQVGPIPFYFSKTTKYLLEIDTSTGGFRGIREVN